jgi:cell wall-associated NlpC family hydrolase
MLQVPLSASPLPIPERFHAVRYNAARFPGAPGRGLEGGANCQRFAYEFIHHYGRTIPDFRSSELWADTEYTAMAETLEPLSLLLFNNTPKPWSAHVGVYLGEGLIVHLSKQIGLPAIWRFACFLRRPEYACHIGAKRVLLQPSCSIPAEAPESPKQSWARGASVYSPYG